MRPASAFWLSALCLCAATAGAANVSTLPPQAANSGLSRAPQRTFVTPAAPAGAVAPGALPGSSLAPLPLPQHLSTFNIVIAPAYDEGDAFDTQFYGMQVFRHRRFHLGLLYVFHVQSQTIQPEWAWSHNGDNWTRTRTPCIALGDEGSFDSRMILFGDVVVTDDELIWLYSGYDWRHNAFMKGRVSSSIGRAMLPLRELDGWLDSLPQP